MTILKAEVLIVLNDRLNRNETDIDEELRWALYDLSSRDNFLMKKTDDTTSDGIAYISKPSNFKEMKLVRFQDSNGDWSKPLEKISFREYLESIEGDTSEDEPEKYCFFNDLIYLFPTPDDDYSVEIWHTKYHDNDLDTIEFDEIYREAIYNGTIAKVAEKFQLDIDFKRHMNLYEIEIAKRSRNLQEIGQPVIQGYNDL